jgi:hypothetical protein
VRGDRRAFGVGLLVAAIAVATVAVATVPMDIGISRGRDSVDEPFVSALRCGVCHAEQLEQWSGSRHAVSHSNALYTQGYIDEPLTFCVNCHSPLAEQVAEVVANRSWYLSQRRRPDLVAERSPEPMADEGITCVVCHERAGDIVHSSDSGRSPHQVRVEPDFATGALCGNCHEFEMFAASGSGLRFTGELMQATLTEWQAWRDAGGKEQCQDCHMPQGSHVFRGVHDQEWLRESVDVRTRAGLLRIRSVGVPTGDLFRNMTVEVDTGSGFRTLHRMGRTYRSETLDGEVVKVIATDTALEPGEWRQVELPEGPLDWRVRYHYGSPFDEARGHLSPDQLVTVIAEGQQRR